MPGADAPRSALQAHNLAMLQRSAQGYAAAALASSSAASYRRHVRYFVNFMRDNKLADHILSGHPLHMSLYISFLARSVSHASLLTYLKGVKALYSRLELDDPFCHAGVRRVLAGVRRCKGAGPSRQKLPVQPWMLEQWAEFLCISASDEGLASFVAMVFAFFGFFRKSTVAVASPRAGEPLDDRVARRMLRRGDIRIDRANYCVWVTLAWSKTIQARERVHEVPLAGRRGSILDPVALYSLLCRRVPAPADAHAFAYPASISGRLVPLSQRAFVASVKRLARRSGLRADDFAGHSFRRGGASFAFEAGVRGELIQAHGDWRSDAYLRYLVFADSDRLSTSRAMQASIAALDAPPRGVGRPRR